MFAKEAPIYKALASFKNRDGITGFEQIEAFLEKMFFEGFKSEFSQYDLSYLKNEAYENLKVWQRLFPVYNFTKKSDLL